MPICKRLLMGIMFVFIGTCHMPDAGAITLIAACSGHIEPLNSIVLSHSIFSDTSLKAPQQLVVITGNTQASKSNCQTLSLPIAQQAIQSAKLISATQWQQLKSGISMVTNAHSPVDLNTSELAAISNPTQPNRHTPATLSSHRHSAILSTWLWEPKLWQMATPDLWAQLADAAIQRIYISIPIDPATNLPCKFEALQAFIRQARQNHVDVWAVEGDPHAILPAEREKYLRRINAYNAYNQMVLAPERLSGMQYDIEPYLLPGFDAEAEVGFQAYWDTIGIFKKHLKMPMNIVLPFWVSTVTIEGKPFLEGLHAADEITVMDYRTDPEQIQQFAEPFLEWGNEHDKPIMVALEAGALPQQTQAVYHPSSSHGELWHIPFAGQHILLLLKEPAMNPAGDSFLLAYKTDLNPDRLTFHNHIRNLINLIPHLQTRLSAWSSYQGLALHQYLEISRQP